MKKGRITSFVGNKIIVHLPSSSVGNIYGKVAFVGKKRVGRVSEIIGRVDSPYAVINSFPRVELDSSALIDKEILIQY